MQFDPGAGVADPRGILEVDQSRVELARRNRAAFAEYILADETTGMGIESVDLHLELHAVCQVYDRVVVIASPEVGKTQQITIAWPLYEMGLDPDGFRCLIGGKKEMIAAKPMRAIRQHIEHNGRYNQVFPNVFPGEPWNDGQLVVGRKPGRIVKDATISVIGATMSILGSRFKLAILDDMLDQEIARSEYQSDKLVDSITGTLESRMLYEWKCRGTGETRRGKIILLANAWYEWDAAHKLVRDHGWHLHRMSVVDGLGKTRWPDKWPQKRIDGYPPASARQHIKCLAKRAGARLVNMAWIEKCKRLGIGETLVRKLETIPEGAGVFCGVDLNHKKRRTSDSTCFFVGMRHPDGRLQPLWVQTEIMDSPQIKRTMVDLWWRYRCKFLVEDNAAQNYIVDDLHADAPELVVEGQTTTGVGQAGNKWDPEFGIGGIANDLSSGLWILPCVEIDGELVCEPELEAWIQDLLSTDPAGGHTPDRVIGSWLFREGAKRVFNYFAGLMGAGLHTQKTPQPGRYDVEQPAGPSDEEVDAGGVAGMWGALGIVLDPDDAAL